MANPEITVLDYQIRINTNIANTHREMADYFARSAAEHQALADQYTEQRNAYLGRAGLSNVEPIIATGMEIA